MMEQKQRTKKYNGIERLVPLVDVKRTLAVSWPMLVDLVHDGTLTAYSVSGRAVNRREVTQGTRGLRVSESDLRAYIESIRVK